MNGFAVVYFRQGKTRKAESQLVRAITLADETEPTLGYAQVLNNLGRVYQKRRKFDKAEEAFKQSLEITERLGSANLENIVQTAWNVEVAITLNNLAAVYAETRRYDEAESLYRRSLMILEQTKPSLDAKIVRTLHSLSRMYSKQGSIALAQSVLARAVEIGRLNPSCRQDMPTILETYAVVLKMLGQSNEAQRLRAEARHIRAEIGLTVRAPNW